VDNHSSTDKTTKAEAPAPEVLQAHGSRSATGEPAQPATPLRRRLRTYRPSHKATFIGIGVIVAILAINAGAIWFIVQQNQSNANANKKTAAVSISSDTLSKLGVNRDPVAGTSTQLTIDPNSRFNGSVTVGNDVSVGGQLKLNGVFSAPSANLSKLQAGDTAIDKLNVNGDGTVSTLNLRNDLNVTGTSRLQGPVILSQLLTVNNNLNVAGNLAVGGTLSTRTFEALSIVADNGLTVGGHIATRGSAPGVGPGCRRERHRFNQWQRPIGNRCRQCRYRRRWWHRRPDIISCGV
jgi:cytoskeletal protein CcmA (bactofilin family)